MKRSSRTANLSFLRLIAWVCRSLCSPYNRRFAARGVSGGEGVSSRTIGSRFGLAFALAFATASSGGRRFGRGGVEVNHTRTLSPFHHLVRRLVLRRWEVREDAQGEK